MRPDDGVHARLTELAVECFDLAAEFAASAPHDPRVHRLVDALWQLREATHALRPDARDAKPEARPSAQ